LLVEFTFSKFRGADEIISSAKKERTIFAMGSMGATSIKRSVFFPKQTAESEGNQYGVLDGLNEVIKLFKYAKKNYWKANEIGDKFLNLIMQAQNNYKPYNPEILSARQIRESARREMYLYTLISYWNTFLGDGK
jgi:hypothetical protein